MRILDAPTTKSDLIQSSTNFIEENAIKGATQNNRSRGVEDPATRDKIKSVVAKWLI